MGNVKQLLLPFYDMREAVFADECSARPRNHVVEEKHTQQRLLRRVEEMCEPVTVTDSFDSWSPFQED